MAGLLTACATHVPAVTKQVDVGGPIVIGRTVTVITGDTSRRYEPRVRFVEIEHQQTNQRFSIEINDQDAHFALSLPSGDYRLNRVQISEGPFMSMADVPTAFSIGTEPVTYLGTWRFGVDSPRYGRMVAVSMVLDADDRSEAVEFLRAQYPELGQQAMVEALPQPAHQETRLYEVMPYPRYPRYFRRHLW